MEKERERETETDTETERGRERKTEEGERERETLLRSCLRRLSDVYVNSSHKRLNFS